MTDIWKDIAGFEGYYQISNLGSVRSVDRIAPDTTGSWGRLRRLKGKLMKTQLLNGYWVVMLYKDSKYRHARVHRLIAEAFIANPENKPHINHINGLRSDNRIENLEWCSHAENMKHCYDIGLRKPIRPEQCPTVKISFEIAEQIRKKRQNGTKNVELQKEYGLCKRSITDIVKNRTWKQ